MRILYLTPDVFARGGISRHNRYQIEALREIYGAGKVRALSLQGPENGRSETTFRVFWHGRARLATSLDRAGLSFQAVQSALLWKPQAIFCAHVNFTPLATRLGLLSGAQTILNVYGLELRNGLSPRYQEHMARMDRLISDCNASAEDVQEHEAHLEPPEVIWDCVDLNRFYPGPRNAAVAQKYGIPFRLRTPVVLTLGELGKTVPHKGYDRLLEIWSDLRAQIPQAHLVIAGGGDDAARLKEKALRLGLEEAVTFTGPVHAADLPALYRLADLFCQVSDTGQSPGIPLAPREALASGVPVIVSDEDSAREAVVGMRNGRIVSPRDPGQLRRAIIEMLSTPEPARRIQCQQARAIAEERFGYGAFRDKHRYFLSKISA